MNSCPKTIYQAPKTSAQKRINRSWWSYAYGAKIHSQFSTQHTSLVGRYKYDSWGKVVKISGANGENLSGDPNHIMNINPFRYRGYYYDRETGFYYLQTRYYDPEVKRFINADGLISNGTGVQGYNMYAYCDNNPVNMKDSEGMRPIEGDSVSNPGIFTPPNWYENAPPPAPAPVPTPVTTAPKNASESQISQISSGFTATGGDYDGVNGQQCVDLTYWYVKNMTGWTYGHGHGKDVVANLIGHENNLGLILWDEANGPPPPWSIFSTPGNTYDYGANGAWQGHTGIIVAVNGNTLTILDTYKTYNVDGSRVNRKDYQWVPGKATFVYVG